jgi:hypothetical protein
MAELRPYQLNIRAQGRPGWRTVPRAVTFNAAAKDSVVVCSIALQVGVPVEVIRKALLRDSQGRPSGPLGAALDLLAEEERGL